MNPQNTIIKEYIAETEKEFEEKFFPLDNEAITMLSWTPKELGDFLQSRQIGLIELMGSLVPEEGIQWMQEGNHKDKKGFTEGFNFAREQFLKNLELNEKRLTPTTSG